MSAIWSSSENIFSLGVLQPVSSRPEEFHLRALPGRVEDWRAGLGRRVSTVPRLQSPPRRTQRADFPHCAPPFASRRGLWDLSCRGDFRPVASHLIAVEQPLECRAATAYSIVPSRSPFASEHAPAGA